MNNWSTRDLVNLHDPWWGLAVPDGPGIFLWLDLGEDQESGHRGRMCGQGAQGRNSWPVGSYFHILTNSTAVPARAGETPALCRAPEMGEARTGNTSDSL